MNKRRWILGVTAAAGISLLALGQSSTAGSGLFSHQVSIGGQVARLHIERADDSFQPLFSKDLSRPLGLEDRVSGQRELERGDDRGQALESGNDHGQDSPAKGELEPGDDHGTDNAQALPGVTATGHDRTQGPSASNSSLPSNDDKELAVNRGGREPGDDKGGGKGK